MNKKYRTLIIDDDLSAISSLEILLDGSYNNIQLLGSALTVKDAVELINKVHPDLVFLDVELPDGNGFNIIDKVTFKNFQVIFTTAFEKYAVKAFEISAVHYLIKPVSRESLDKAIMKLENYHANYEQYSMLKYSLEKKYYKIALPTENKMIIVDLVDIIRIESDNNYTNFHLINKKEILISKTLKKVEELLSNSGFYRIHQKHLINISYISEIIKTKSPQVILKNGDNIPVSESRKNELYKIFEENTLRIT